MKTNSHAQIKRMVLAAMFLAIGQVLSFLTGQIPEIGRMLLPMHLPVLLCGFICGWPYGLAVGFICPLMRSALFGIPVIFPMAVAMAFELAAYGFLAGFLFTRARWQCVLSLFRSLVIAMLGGRIVYGVFMALISAFGLTKDPFTFAAFIAAEFTGCVPGIILQLIAIPLIMLALDRTHMVPFRKKESAEKADA